MEYTSHLYKCVLSFEQEAKYYNWFRHALNCLLKPPDSSYLYLP